jgi:hypothetical protein
MFDRTTTQNDGETDVRAKDFMHTPKPSIKNNTVIKVRRGNKTREKPPPCPPHYEIDERGRSPKREDDPRPSQRPSQRPKQSPAETETINNVININLI